MKNVVVIGATGHFGARICRRLISEPGVNVLVASRAASTAMRLASELRSLTPDASVSGIQLDQNADDFPSALSELDPFLVIHTAGPYQGQDYRVAKACIHCGSHYVDLADGREFVDGFGCLDTSARRAGVLLVAGASTLPGVSSAVVDHLIHDFRSIDSVRISIAPAQQTPRGTSTIAAVLSYCGKPFSVLESGRRTKRFGWMDMRVYKYPTLGRRLAGACDVPDLALLPKQLPSLKTVMFHAALESSLEQGTLWIMGWLTRLGVVNDWGPLVPFFRRLSNWTMRLGSDCGGMHVEVSGAGETGQALKRTWYLTARKNHGPEIPCSPALVIARRLINGTERRRGAFACVGFVSLGDFDDEVRELEVTWEVVDER